MTQWPCPRWTHEAHVGRTYEVRLSAHLFDDDVAELGSADLRGPFHQAREVVGDGPGGDGAVDAFDDQVGCLGPAHVPEHHFPGEDDGTRVHFVQVGVLGCGSVRGFEDGVAGDVVDVTAGSDPDTPDLGREGVGEIIAVQVERGDDVELIGPRQYLL